VPLKKMPRKILALVAGSLLLVLLVLGVRWLSDTPGSRDSANSRAERTAMDAPAFPAGAPRQPSRQTVLEPTRTVVGRVRTADGTWMAAGLRFTLAGSEPADHREGASDASGRFAVEIPGAWDAVDIEATAPPNWLGRMTVRALGSAAYTMEDDMVLHRTTRLRMRLQVDDVLLSALRAGSAGTVSVATRRAGSTPSLWQPQVAAMETARFRIDGLHHSATTLLQYEGSQQQEVVWSYSEPNRNWPMILEVESLPLDAPVFDSTCRLGVARLLHGVVADSARKVTPHVGLVATSEVGSGRSPRLLLRFFSDAAGRFATLVPAGAYGSIRIDMDGFSEVAWRAGEPVTVPGGLADFTRVKLLDGEGDPVLAYRVRQHNDGRRGFDGRIFEKDIVHSDAGIQITRWKGLITGTLLYFLVPGVGEFVHACDSDVKPGDTYVVRLGAARLGAVTVWWPSASREEPERTEVYMETAERAGSRRKERYRFLLPPTSAWSGDSWTAKQILPGDYRCLVRRGEKTLCDVSLSVRDGQTATIHVEPR
jgi:hypothetical protein